MCFYVKILIYEGIHTWMSNYKSIHYISKKDVFFFKKNTCITPVKYNFTKSRH